MNGISLFFHRLGVVAASLVILVGLVLCIAAINAGDARFLGSLVALILMIAVAIYVAARAIGWIINGLFG